MAALVKQYETYPGMRAFAARGSIISSNDGGTRSVNLDISGPDLASLFQVAQAAYARAEAVFIDGVRQPTDNHQTRLRERYRDLDESDLPKAYDW